MLFTLGFASSENGLRRSDAIIAEAAGNGSTAMSVANQDVIVQLWPQIKQLKLYEG